MILKEENLQNKEQQKRLKGDNEGKKIKLGTKKERQN